MKFLKSIFRALDRVRLIVIDVLMIAIEVFCILTFQFWTLLQVLLYHTVIRWIFTTIDD